MLRRKRGSTEWLEFEQLASIPGLVHAVFLRENSDIESVIGQGEVVHGKQCHGVKIAFEPSEEEECDGLVTQRAGKGLEIRHADCQAAIFYDPIHRVIANVHAGWRGSVQNIYAKTIDFLREKVDSRPEELIVAISPSLGPCCGEFRNFRIELPEEFWSFQVRPTYFDFWEISRRQLLAKGILSHHIEIAGICTCCNPSDYHSYRRDKTKERNSTIVALKQ